MKWIHASREDGSTLQLSVDAQGQLWLSEQGAQHQIGRPTDFVATKPAKTMVEIDLGQYGRVRSMEIDVVDAWFAHLDLSGERAKKPMSPGKIVSVIFGSIALAIFVTFYFGLPWIAKKAAEHMPVEWEKSLAEGTLSSLENNGFTETTISEAEQARYRALFAKVVAGASYGLPVTLEFRNWTDANAFAIPGGTVVITDQMLKLMTTDDEFSAVMAHEVGHLEKRHGVRSVLQQSGAWLVIGLLVGDGSALGTIATALPATLVDSAYSRSFEREADDYAFARLKQMQISPAAFASLMRKMQAQSEASGSGALKYFSSHPPTDERIESAEDAAK